MMWLKRYWRLLVDGVSMNVLDWYNHVRYYGSMESMYYNSLLGNPRPELSDEFQSAMLALAQAAAEAKISMLAYHQESEPYTPPESLQTQYEPMEMAPADWRKP
jgi:hypothetical protein